MLRSKKIQTKIYNYGIAHVQTKSFISHVFKLHFTTLCSIDFINTHLEIFVEKNFVLPLATIIYPKYKCICVLAWTLDEAKLFPAGTASSSMNIKAPSSYE